MIDLNQVVLTITGAAGARNVVGDLLCGVANALNGGGPSATQLQALASSIDQIVAQL